MNRQQTRPRDNQRDNQRGANQRRRQQGKRPAQVDVWRTPGELPEVAPIAIPHEVGALLRSLGDPPVGNGAAAAGYFNAVCERAAAVAFALAVSADLLADAD
ncbi:MAG: hypothetical protein Q7V88_07405 [Actinomycetota bacterium]|nr:hypothetical protein [Actinomycetota bacterium]